MKKEIIRRNLEVNEEDHENNLFALVDELRQMMADSKGALPPNHRTDFDFLSIFLRVRNYNVRKAFKSMQMSFSFVARNESIVYGVKPISFVPWIKRASVYALKYPDRDGFPIVVGRAGDWDPMEFPVRVAMAAIAFQLQELISFSRAVQRHGGHAIIDCSGMCLQQVKEISSPSVAKCLAQSVQGGFPIKIKGIHIINHPSIFWILYCIAMRLISKKLRKRVHFHNSLESLHQHFSPEILPESLGGVLTKDEAILEEFNDSMLARNDCFEKYYFNTDDSVTLPEVPM